MSNPRRVTLRRTARAIRQNLATLLAVTSLAFTVVYVRYETHLFCQVIGPFAAAPVQRPSNPEAKPAQANQYEWHKRFVALSRSLDC